MENTQNIQLNRQFMKSQFAAFSNMESDSDKKLPRPELQKVYEENAQLIDLPEVGPELLKVNDLYACINARMSRRDYTEEEISLEELSFLLKACQGVKRVIGKNIVTLRTVPSAGARHPFETYLIINRVTGLRKGVYRYIPISHQLLFLFEQEEDMSQQLTDATIDQPFVGESAVVFVWSCIPYRAEYSYGFTAARMALIDAGHISQNLYLAAEALELGTCCVSAYDQEYMDRLLKLDGEDEFVIWLAPVGRNKPEEEQA